VKKSATGMENTGIRGIPAGIGNLGPSYGVVSLDTPDRTRATSSEGVGQEPLAWIKVNR